MPSGGKTGFALLVVRRCGASRSPLLALVLLLLLVLVACSPAAPNTTPVVDDDATGSIAITVEGRRVLMPISLSPGPTRTRTPLPPLRHSLTWPQEYTLVAEAVPGYAVVGDATLKVQVEEDAQTSVTVRYTNIPPASLGSLDITVEAWPVPTPTSLSPGPTSSTRS